MITFHVYFNADTEFRSIVQHTVIEKCTFSKKVTFFTVSKSVWATPLIYNTANSNKYHRLDRCNFNNMLNLILLILAALH